MFNRRRNVALYYAIGIGAGVLALAGAGTMFFMSRRRNVRMRDVTAQAKRVIQRTTHHAPTERSTSSTQHHAKRSKANGHSRGHNARA